MGSLIPGYEYDIFISYRQKDNKYDGWVTEFVDNLKKELEATFKEDISVYFDVNPDDGLLANHDVNASLRNKLKCLIFIPVISRTYCDTKSFAWVHEFMEFVSQASSEKPGMKVRLPNGNVASRVLPVRIYELDNEDIKLCESVTGDVFRSIDFIFKSPGVNRPLRMKEENPQDNLNHTHYRDQINKVANAIKEIISAISLSDEKVEEKAVDYSKGIPDSKSDKKYAFIKWLLPVLIIVVAGIFLLYNRYEAGEETEKSIAVLPFKLLSDEPDKQYLADGMMDAILLHLQKFSDVKVLSRTSVEQYRVTKKTISKIGKELNAGYLLEGSFMKHGDNIKLIVQMIESDKDRHLWAEEYNIEWKEVFTVQSDIAKAIADKLHMKINPEEKALIEKIPTTNMEAYDIYIKGLGFYNEYEKSRQLDLYNKSMTFYKTSIAMDTTFARAYTGLAKLYVSRYYWESFFKENFLDTCRLLIDKAISADPLDEEAYFLRGTFKQFYGKFQEAVEDYDITLKINPNFSNAYLYKGSVFTWNLHDFVKGIMNYESALNLIYGEERPHIMRRLGRAYLDAGFVEKAREIYNSAYLLDGNTRYHYGSLVWLETSNGNFREAVNLSRKVMEIDSTYSPDLFIFSMVPGYENEAYSLAKRTIEENSKSGSFSLIGTHRIGYAYYKAGHIEESKKFFDQQVKYCLEQIKLNRPLAQRRQAHYDLAATYAFLGEKEKAYRYLDEAGTLDFYELWWVTLAKNDPLFDSIRKEERFRKFIENMERKLGIQHEKLREWLENK